MAPDFRIEAFGEAAVIVLLGGGIDEASYQQLAALSKAVRQAPPQGFVELVPAYNSLLVVFDPRVSTVEIIMAEVRAKTLALPRIHTDAPRDIIELPVAYGGEYGPDIEAVAATAGLSVEEVIKRHSAQPYLVYMLGFTPGFPYLGGMDPRLATPRLKTPRTKVAAGSVGIADAQTGVYPLESPGGWNLIGRTPLALFDPSRPEPALLAPGKYVRFVPVEHREFESLYRGGADSGQPGRPPSPSISAPTAYTSPVSRAFGPKSIPGSSSGIVIHKSGALSTVQDAGRFGYQLTGVPPSGPMDSYSMSLANILAGNDPDSACIECTLGGLELAFEGPAIFALAGADAPAFLNDREVPLHRTLRAAPGDILRLGLANRGLRVYVSFQGGLAVPIVMGSRSTFQKGGFGGFKGRALVAGDRLPLACSSDRASETGSESPIPDRFVPEACLPRFSEELRIRAIPSHETERFTPAGLACFFSSTYIVGQKSDRMGCRLEGPRIEHTSGADIISSGVQTGTVQVPGDGQPIVLMADRQTTGGYTRIAQVIQADLPLLGQARPGDRIRFISSTPAEASRALAERLALLSSVAGSLLPEIRETHAEIARQLRVQINGQTFSVSIQEVF